MSDAEPLPEPAGDALPDSFVVEDQSDSAEPGKLAGAMAVIEATEGQLGDIEAALGRLESGQYRVCEICGARLDAAALTAAPTLRRCLIHAG